jgi:AraC family transcriptional regulator, positive regulator of tynA and feaB
MRQMLGYPDDPRYLVDLNDDVVDSFQHKRRFLEATALSFPNVVVGRLAHSFRGAARGLTVAGKTIARVRTSSVTINASASRGKVAGLDGWCKLMWQIGGGARFEDAYGRFRLEKGALAILPMSSDYQLENEESSDQLMMVFNPADRKEWAQIAHDHVRQPIEPSSAIAAAAAVVASMMRHATGQATDMLACDAALDLIFRTISHNQAPCEAYLRKAAALVAQRLPDGGYGPVELARDLGVSRRSLYEVFSRAGSTPATFIRQIRLEHAKQDIIQAKGPPMSLLQIALRNGFADGSSFSRAFKDAFGLSPRSWRGNRSFSSF